MPTKTLILEYTLITCRKPPRNIKGFPIGVIWFWMSLSGSFIIYRASVQPIDLLAKERQEAFQLRKELTCADLQEIARANEVIRKDGRHRLVEKWQMRWYGEHTGRWTYHLIPELATWLNREHGRVDFYFARALSGHGCFNAYPWCICFLHILVFFFVKKFSFCYV